jgi:hypothetical protein
MGEGRHGSTIVDFGARWRWVVGFTPRPLYSSGEKASSTHWIGGWVGPRTGLDAMGKRKIVSLQGIEHRPSSP